MIVTGCILVMLGIVGFAFQKNADVDEPEITPTPDELDSPD
jgi:hypothetical protein